MAYSDLIQGNAAQFLPYTMSKPLDVVQKDLRLKSVYRMHALESPFGVSRKVTAVLEDYVNNLSIRNSYPKINLYPDNNCYKLKCKLHENRLYDINKMIVGSDVFELSNLIIHAFLNPSMCAAMPALSSYEIESYLSVLGIKLILTPISEDWSPNLSILAQEVNRHDARLVYIANPSIPLGGFATRHRIQKFLEQLNPQKTIVVINEEFSDYLGHGYSDFYPLIDKYPNLILLRSFSHAFGLTDLRIGYALASEEIASLLNVMHMPYGVSQLAQDCACAALDDLSFTQHVIHCTNVERNRIHDFCSFFSLHMLNTITNSVTIPFGSRLGRIYHDLQRAGIFIRDLNYLGLEGLCNITIGRSSQTDILLQTLEKSLMSFMMDESEFLDVQQEARTIQAAEQDALTDNRLNAMQNRSQHRKKADDEDHPFDFSTLSKDFNS